MSEIVKIIGIGFIGTIMCIVLREYKNEFVLPVTVITGIIIFSLVFNKLEGIINLIKNISNKTGIDSKFIIILLKVTGIALLTEFASSICKDVGENAICTKMEFAGKIIMVSLSIPIISSLLELTLEILN